MCPCLIPGWVDVSWDGGSTNSYRMGAEGKFDLALAPSHDPDRLNRPKESGGRSGSALSKKSSSTPSLTDTGSSKASVASTEQAASADNITKEIKSVCSDCLVQSSSTCETMMCQLMLFQKENFDQEQDGWEHNQKRGLTAAQHRGEWEAVKRVKKA